MIGAGATAIGHLLDIGFLQNIREVDQYVTRTNAGAMPIARGKRFTEDDRIRQALISDLYCTGEIRPQAIERQFGIVFSDYFAREIKIIEELDRDGLVKQEGSGVIRATMPLGRVLLRNVAAVFDAYLDRDAYRVGDRRCFSANA